MSQELLYEVEDQIATITFNRPERMNALTHELEAELHRRFDDADADRSVRVIILPAPVVPSAPATIRARWKIRHPPLRPDGKVACRVHRVVAAHRRAARHLLDAYVGLAKPIIAAVNGWAMGGGFWYQLAADITIASEEAVFAQPEVRHISNSTFLFGALCGWKAANRWALTGDHFDAQEALRLGMVNEVVPHDALMDTARALAKRIALVPEPAVRLNKAITMKGIQAAGVYSGLLLEGTLGALAHSSHNELREQLHEASATVGSKPISTCETGHSSPSLWARARPRDARRRKCAARTQVPMPSSRPSGSAIRREREPHASA